MRSRHEIKHCIRPSRFLFRELGHFFHDSAYSTEQTFHIVFHRRFLAGNDSQENTISIVDVDGAGLGSVSDHLLVEQYFRILLQDAGMLLFELWSDSAQDGDCETLRPPMLQQAQAG